MIHVLNVIFGLIPTLILAGSIASGIDDDLHHRRTFLLVYGLWSITLAMWNWMRSAPVAWTALWLVAGVLALGIPYAVRSFRRYRQRGSS